jgi:hypothetical protein
MDIEYRPSRLTDKELVGIFPEIREVIPLKIKECREAIKKQEQEITDALKKVYALKTDGFSEWFGEEVVKMYLMPEMNRLEKTLFRLTNFKYLLNPNQKKSVQFKFKEKIEIAKQYPIEELAGNFMDFRKNGNRLIALCPLHNEKTPSFVIYTEKNRFYCFGCQAKGDVITLTMALRGITFREAVLMLQN